jgi:NitT/TauT family transport system substrate-binding protein
MPIRGWLNGTDHFDEIIGMGISHRSTVPFGGLRGRLRRVLAAGAVLALLGTATACGEESGSAGGTGLEKTNLKVAFLPITDAAALHIAIQRGFFKQEGLNVELEQIASGALAPPRLKSGALDISLTQYVSAITATEKGVAKWRFLADAYQGAPNVWVLMVGPNSPIHAPKDLAGKTIAVLTLRSLPTLMIEETLKHHGVDHTSVKFVEMPVTQMPQAMRTRQVDAVWISEPFITDTKRRMGARIVADTGAPGTATADFPLSGWGTLDTWVEKNPNTAAAFQRAILKGQRIAASNRAEVSKILPTYVKGLDASTAGVITLGRYGTSLDPSRLQAVSDLMRKNGYLGKRVDVGQMVVPAPAR